MAISVELEPIEPISQETGADQFINRRIIPQLKNRQVGRAYPDDAPSQIDEHHLTLINIKCGWSREVSFQ